MGLVLLVGLLAMPACSDDSNEKKDTSVADLSTVDSVKVDKSNTDAKQPDTNGGTKATVSGTARRTSATCPPTLDFMGTVCVSVRSSCADANSEVASATVANADLSLPREQDMSKKADWEVKDVPDGTWQIYGMLDDDGSGCGDLTKDDVYLTSCVEVTVTNGQDVTGVELKFDAKKP